MPQQEEHTKTTGRGVKLKMRGGQKVMKDQQQMMNMKLS